MPNPCCWDECSEVFGHTDELVVHLSAHLGSPQDQCKWRGCAANLGENVTTAVVLRHVMVEHAALRPHHCSQCHKNFSAPNFLEIHIRVIHRKKVETCMCPLSDCRYNDTSLVGLQQHCLLAHGVQGILDFNAALFSNEIRKILPNHRIPTAFVQQSLTQILQLERRIVPHATDESIDGFYNRMTIKLHEIAVELATKERIIEEKAEKSEQNAKAQQENVSPSCSKTSEVALKKEKPVTTPLENVETQIPPEISQPASETCEIQPKTAGIGVQKKVKIEVVTLEDESSQNLSQTPSNSGVLCSSGQVQHKNDVENGMEMNQNESSPQDIDLRSQNSEESAMRFVESPLASSTSSSDGHVGDEPKSHTTGRFSPTTMLKIFGERLGGENHKYGRPDSLLSEAERRLIQEMEDRNKIEKTVTPEPVKNVKNSGKKVKENSKNVVSVPIVTAPTMTGSGRMIFPPNSPVLTEKENEDSLIPKAPGDTVYHKTIVNHKPNVVKVEPSEHVVVDRVEKRNFLPTERASGSDEGECTPSRSASLQSRARQISTGSSRCSDPRPRRYRVASEVEAVAEATGVTRHSRIEAGARDEGDRAVPAEVCQAGTQAEDGEGRAPEDEVRVGVQGEDRQVREEDPEEMLVQEERRKRSPGRGKARNHLVQRTGQCRVRTSTSSIRNDEFEKSISSIRNDGKKFPEIIEISSDTETEIPTPAGPVSLPETAASGRSKSQKRAAKRKRKKERDRAELDTSVPKPNVTHKKARLEKYKQLQGTRNMVMNTMPMIENTANQRAQFSEIPPKSAVLIMENAKFKSKSKLRTFFGPAYGSIRIFLVTFYGQPGYVIHFVDQARAASFMQRYRDKELLENTFGHMTLLQWYDEVKHYIELV
ncbi:unnamed protein product [Bursaphelenchus xylophilus]|uniref:(pine wood nematode) hypothetical protein n=1 Tax=Bursaphelenchus xylophilus TaxID=6326 RepID=A0A7I8X9L8_BURXY|nr:unnamed protein product [Bursaphelenchus xylophilus]CAG9132105.1 unnamed protein product [Bursaphelenchus xylophilus]